jgi:glycosyltransferase involved in cell wall biosynthesis
MTAGVTLAHDYATQRGGAERVALKIAEAFPGSPMYTTLYEPSETFPEFEGLDLRTSGLDRFGLLRRHHRLALPLLASAVNAQRIDGGVLVASSTGWAHGYRGADHTVVYCHAPARWLYQKQRYLGSHAGPGVRGRVRQVAAKAAVSGLMTPLRRWDGRQARQADLYLANSTVTQRAIAEVYGIEAEILAPPPALLPVGDERAPEGVEPGFLLCVARLLPYKNVDVIIEAVNSLPGVRLVVVGAGPDRERLLELAGPEVTLAGRVDDEELRWLYRNCSALVAASHEDYGLSPLEAGSFGRPSLVLGDGGFLDTVVEGRTGVFFGSPDPGPIAEGIGDVLSQRWDAREIAAHVDCFSAQRFTRRLHDVVAQFGADFATTEMIPTQRVQQAPAAAGRSLVA